MPPLNSAPCLRMMFNVPPMPWLSMSLVGLRMISTRSTSSAGMRSTSTVLSLPEPEMRRPLIGIWVYSEPMPRNDGVAAYSPTSSLNGHARRALHHFADRQRLEALEVLFGISEHRLGQLGALARIDALGEHLDEFQGVFAWPVRRRWPPPSPARSTPRLPGRFHASTVSSVPPRTLGASLHRA